VTFAADEIARRIEHTLLRSEASTGQIDALCDEASVWGFKGVCVNPVHVCQAVRRLATNSGSRAGATAPVVVSVAGFPLGGCATATKTDQAMRAVGEGATEIDMVARIGAIVDGDYITVRKDIEAVARGVHNALPTGILKVILETAALTTQQIELGCRCCIDGGADFLKTSTGFHPAGGATVEHVRLLHRYGAGLLVKASGGIRTAEQARAMLDAGAARLGTSSGLAIVEQLRRSPP